MYKGAIRNDTYSEWHVCLKQLCEKYLFAPMYLIIVLLPLLSHKVAMVFLESFHKSRKHLGVGCLISGLSRRAGTFHYKYCTRAIISRGLYIFYPISKDHVCTVTFGLMYGLYSRAASNQERPMMARVRYFFLRR